MLTNHNLHKMIANQNIFKSPLPDIDFQPSDIVTAVFGKTVSADKSNKVALVDEDGKQFTYSQLYDQITAFAAGLYQLGYRKGDCIAIYSTNHIQFPIVLFGAAKLGLTVTPCNASYIASVF